MLTIYKLPVIVRFFPVYVAFISFLLVNTLYFFLKSRVDQLHADDSFIVFQLKLLKF